VNIWVFNAQNISQPLQ